MRMRLSGGKQVAGEAEVANAAITETGVAAETAGKKSAAASSGIKRSLSSQISAMRSIGTSLTKYVSVPILGVAAISGKFAIDFDRNMRNVNSIAQLPERQFERLKQSVLDLAGPTAQSPNTLAEGLYDLVSSGFNASEAIRILHKSALAASAGLTTTEVSTKAVAAALNAYHLPAKAAGKVSDTLFETVNRGVLTFDQLASSIGDALPFASQLGVGLNQVGAAISTMTKQGLSAPESVTRLKNVMVTLIKPGKDLQTALDSMNTSGEALVKKKGLQGALEAIIGTTDGSKASIAALFPNIRALGGVLSLTGKSAKTAHEDLAAFKNTTGATNKVLKEQEKSFGFQMQRAWASLQAVLIEIGAEVLPIVIPPFLHLVGMVRDAIKWFGGLPSPIKKVGGELAVMAALAGPLLYVASSVLTLAKNLGILKATEAGGLALNKGKLGRLGAGAVGAAAFAVGQSGVGGKAGEAVGNIGGLAGMGFAVGGPWGAAIGAAGGAALTFGPALMGLLETEKKVNPLQQKLAQSAKGMAAAFKTARSAVRNLKISEDAVERTQKHHHAATRAQTAAQNGLNAARRRFGLDSQQAIRAEIRMARAIRGVTDARRDQKRAERQHGQELRTTKELLRYATLEERHRINVLEASRSQLQKQKTAMEGDKASLQELQPINEKLSASNQGLRKSHQRLAQTILEGGRVAGPTYAGFLKKGSRASLEYGSRINATKEKLQTMKTALNEVTRAIQATDNAFEAGILGQQGNVLREGIESAEGELGNLGGGGRKPSGGHNRDSGHQPGKSGRRNTGAEPGGSAALKRLMASGGRQPRKQVIEVPVYLNKRKIAEAIVETQDNEDARS